MLLNTERMSGPKLDIYETMYPSHLMHINPMANHVEGRTYTNHSSYELFRNVMSRNGSAHYNNRKDFLMHSHSALSIPPNGNKHMQSSQSNGKVFYNKREYWNSKSQGKSKRLQHGNSAPCLISAVTDESGDSGISRSPTPSKQQHSISCHVNSHAESILLPLNLQEKEFTCNNQQSNKTIPQRREIQLQPKRRSNYNNNRNQGSFYRNRRSTTNSVILHYPTPFPPSALFTPYYTAPDRFLLRSHLMQVTQVPDELLNGSIWDQLSQSTWTKFVVNQQTQETFRKKMTLWKCLYVYIKQYFPKHGLYLVGSTMNGFGSDYSDVDMCLLIRYTEVERNEALSYLSNILKLLERCEFVEKLELIQAKVPLLKFRDSKQGLHVDLNCNNSVGIRNTHLLYCYGQMDWRVKPLVLVVKLWAQWHNINDAKNMTISSYSLALMVIHFLQCGVNPRILPCLHSLYAEKFAVDIDIGSIDIHEELEPFESENKQSLGELLLQFFQYYSTFDFFKYAISVRLGSVIPVEDCRHVRTFKNDPHQWKFLCIEEPYELTNTARSVYLPDKFKLIRTIIIQTAQVLSKTRKLESIFTLEAS